MNALMKGLIATVIVLAQPISNANAATYLFHNDHLGTPQALTDSDQQVVWQSVQDPFGEVEEVVNVVEQNLRFAGQYFDVETGLHYNYFRNYDPSTGRYMTSDPIGLQGGLNQFVYVSQNPVTRTDFFGLVGRDSLTNGILNAIRRGDFQEAQLLVRNSGRTAAQLKKLAQQCASARKKDLVDELKDAKKAGGKSAKSGQNGTPNVQAGAQLTREGNKLPKGPLREAFKKMGEQSRQQGRAGNH